MRRVIVIATLVLSATVAFAQFGGPLIALRNWDARVRAVLEQKAAGKAEKEERMKGVIHDLFDYEMHARESFGRSWDSMSPTDRKTAVECIKVLLERSAVEKLQNFMSQPVEYQKESFDSGNPDRASVLTRVKGKREVVYRFRWGNGEWRIFDIVIGGSSSLENNRTAFAKEIRSAGVASLLSKLRKKAKIG